MFLRQVKCSAAVLLVLLHVQSLIAVENTWDFAVRATATVQTSPPRITLSWPQDTVSTPTSYVVHRKNPNDASWGSGVTLLGTTTSYVDNSVSLGNAYEYQIVKNTASYVGYGYIYAGINCPLVESRGKLILVVDNTFSSSLSNELARLQENLVGDGWQVIRLNVARSQSVATTKSQIAGVYWNDPANTKALFLFGHVPVPYSGNIFPDEHFDHRGAWPSDGFYGDMDGTWTDASVNTISAADSRNDNVPGDGKYDQSLFPSPVELQIGRVDLANMPGRITFGGSPTFPSETELLRNYLNKNHNYRHKVFSAPQRAILYDGVGVYGGESFAATGWRNFAPFFGHANINHITSPGMWITTLSSDVYIFAYGAGGGTAQSIAGLGWNGPYYDLYTRDVVNNNAKAVFVMSFGSWLGDWDCEDDIMRAFLCTSSYGLASCWGASPHWYLHPMALGETIGFGTRLTMNNTTNGLYRNQKNPYAAQIHTALMGDPTLRLHTVAPPANLVANTNNNGVALSWNASFDSVPGYYVYRSGNANGPFTRISSLVSGTSFLDTNAPSGTNIYMLRAVRSESTPSGTYTNASQGIFLTVNVTKPLVLSIRRGGANVQLTWPAYPNAVYRVRYKTNLTATNWTEIASDISTNGQTIVWSEGASSAQRYYRIVRTR